MKGDVKLEEVLDSYQKWKSVNLLHIRNGFDPFDVEAGEYEVIPPGAEVNKKSKIEAELSSFNVLINNKLVLSDLNLVDRNGYNRAISKVIQIREQH